MTRFPLATYAATLSERRRNTMAYVAPYVTYAALAREPLQVLARFRRR